jgi:hypothetical protein
MPFKRCVSDWGQIFSLPTKQHLRGSQHVGRVRESLNQFVDVWYVDEEIVVDFQKEVDLRAEVAEPFQCHDCLVGQVSIRIHEISLNQITMNLK